jgi:hypothetical protein
MQIDPLNLTCAVLQDHKSICRELLLGMQCTLGTISGMALQHCSLFWPNQPQVSTFVYLYGRLFIAQVKGSLLHRMQMGLKPVEYGKTKSPLLATLFSHRS